MHLRSGHLGILILNTKYFTEIYRLRPYHVENTRSRPISEVKLRRAQLVLTWVTGWEYWVS